jgi:hypothetical protein
MNRAAQPSEVRRVGTSNWVFPTVEHVEKALLAQRCPDRKGERLRLPDDWYFKVAADEKFLSIDDALILGQFNTFAELCLSHERSPRSFNSETRRNVAMVFTANCALPGHWIP